MLLPSTSCTSVRHQLLDLIRMKSNGPWNKGQQKKDYWMVSSGFKYMNLQKVGNSYPPSWCFSWYPLITGLGSTNISSKKPLKSRWHLVITSLQSLSIGVCTGAGNPAQGGIRGSCRYVEDRYGSWPKGCCLALLSPALLMGAYRLLWVF